MRLDGFATTYANWRTLNGICLTIDVDFAPDYMIEHVLDILEAQSARATIFATHDSPLLRRLPVARYEIALHPYLEPSSTQGCGLVDILARLRASYPDAVGNRFHRLDFAYADLVGLGRLGMLYDVSTLRFNCPCLLPAWHADLGLVLFTYSCEDGICENAGLPLSLDAIDLDSAGLKIVNFHPLNVYLNGAGPETRLAFQRENPVLPDCPRAVAERYRRREQGAEHALTALLHDLKLRGAAFFLLREVADAYRAASMPA